MITPPPSTTNRAWREILALSAVVFGVTVAISFLLTWHVASPPEWGDYADHFPFFREALIDLVYFRRLNEWGVYWNRILLHGLEFYFFAHTGAVLLIAFIMASFIFWLFYSLGGSDGLYHKAGAQLFFHGFAAKHAKRALKNERRLPPRNRGQITPRSSY